MTTHAPTTYQVEIMLRGDEQVYSETVHHIGAAPAAWTADDAATVLQSTLLAIDRALNPGRTDEPSTLTFRGINWIVSPHEKGVVLALEIHSASAVAGPFAIPQATLEGLLTDAVNAPTSGGGVVH
ncbi:MAG: hypothetical protein IT182_15730 [Acidobacteria bacterium]|nr:hypothetical protein [Acidobacteriota bacterium]